jgi:hypothetical protein
MSKYIKHVRLLLIYYFLGTGFNNADKLAQTSRSKVFLTEPDFVKYQSTLSKTARKSTTGFGHRAHAQKYNFKDDKINGNIDYDSFRKSLMTPQKLMIPKSSNLNQIKTVDHLNQLLNPGNKILDRNYQRDLEDGVNLNDQDIDLNDDQLDDKLLNPENEQAIESLSKYMNIMLTRHLKFNQIEELEIKKRRVEDLDLDNITEHFISKKTILNKVFDSYIKYKSQVNHYEAQFLNDIYK